jgi:phosphoglycolate phosphatase-like HAD superfamily hydrolase
VTEREPALRIAFDMDGVLADMHAALSLEAGRMFSGHEAATAEALEAALEPDTPLLALTTQQTERLWQRVAGTRDFWDQLGETEPGIVARLARLADERRWEVIFLTQRPPTRGATVQKQTQAWLRRHGYDFPSVYTTRGSRGAIAAALDLDVVVDDRFEGCVEVADESSARAILVDRQPDERTSHRARRMGISVVPSAGDCLTLLERAEQPRAAAVGLVSRLRQVLRRKSPASDR